MTDNTQDTPENKRRKRSRRRTRKRSNVAPYIGGAIVLLIIVLLGYWWITINEISSLNDVFDWFRGASTEVRESELLENSRVMGEG